MRAAVNFPLKNFGPFRNEKYAKAQGVAAETGQQDT
jgi:hypothetical protein